MTPESSVLKRIRMFESPTSDIGANLEVPSPDLSPPETKGENTGSRYRLKSVPAVKGGSGGKKGNIVRGRADETRDEAAEEEKQSRHRAQHAEVRDASYRMEGMVRNQASQKTSYSEKYSKKSNQEKTPTKMQSKHKGGRAPVVSMSLMEQVARNPSAASPLRQKTRTRSVFSETAASSTPRGKDQDRRSTQVELASNDFKPNPMEPSNTYHGGKQKGSEKMRMSPSDTTNERSSHNQERDGRKGHNIELTRNLNSASVIIQEEKASSIGSTSSSRSSLSNKELGNIAQRAVKLATVRAETRATRMRSSPLHQILMESRSRSSTFSDQPTMTSGTRLKKGLVLQPPSPRIRTKKGPSNSTPSSSTPSSSDPVQPFGADRRMNNRTSRAARFAALADLKPALPGKTTKKADDVTASQKNVSASVENVAVSQKTTAKKEEIVVASQKTTPISTRKSAALASRPSPSFSPARASPSPSRGHKVLAAKLGPVIHHTSTREAARRQSSSLRPVPTTNTSNKRSSHVVITASTSSASQSRAGVSTSDSSASVSRTGVSTSRSSGPTNHLGVSSSQSSTSVSRDDRNQRQFPVYGYGRNNVQSVSATTDDDYDDTSTVVSESSFVRKTRPALVSAVQKSRLYPKGNNVNAVTRQSNFGVKASITSSSEESVTKEAMRESSKKKRLQSKKIEEANLVSTSEDSISDRQSYGLRKRTQDVKRTVDLARQARLAAEQRRLPERKSRAASPARAFPVQKSQISSEDRFATNAIQAISSSSEQDESLLGDNIEKRHKLITGFETSMQVTTDVKAQNSSDADISKILGEAPQQGQETTSSEDSGITSSPQEMLDSLSSTNDGEDAEATNEKGGRERKISVKVTTTSGGIPNPPEQTSSESSESKPETLRWWQKNYGRKVKGATNTVVRSALSRISPTKKSESKRPFKPIGSEEDDDIFFGLDESDNNREQTKLDRGMLGASSDSSDNGGLAIPVPYLQGMEKGGNRKKQKSAVGHPALGSSNLKKVDQNVENIVREESRFESGQKEHRNSLKSLPVETIEEGSHEDEKAAAKPETDIDSITESSSTDKKSADKREVDENESPSEGTSIADISEETHAEPGSLFMHFGKAIVDGFANACRVPDVPMNAGCFSDAKSKCATRAGDVFKIESVDDDEYSMLDDETRTSYGQSYASTYYTNDESFLETPRGDAGSENLRRRTDAIPKEVSSPTRRSDNARKRQLAQKELLEHAKRAVELDRGPQKKQEHHHRQVIKADADILSPRGIKVPLSPREKTRLMMFTTKVEENGIEVLKLNQRNAWQLKYLVLSQEFNEKQCPTSLLWQKTRKPPRSKASAISSAGKGGMDFYQLLEVSRPEGSNAQIAMIPKKFRKEFPKFVGITLSYETGGSRRDLFLCFKDQEESEIFFSALQVIQEILRRENDMLLLEGERGSF